MKLHLKEYREKRFIRLLKEFNDVTDQIRNEPWVEVKPYRWGWNIYMDLREDAKRRDDAPEMMHAIKLTSKHYHTLDINVVKSIRAGLTEYKSFGKRGKRWTRAHRKSIWFRTTPDGQFTNSVIPFRNGISIETYDKLAANIKKFFYYHSNESKIYHWRKPEYRLDIPSYYLRARAEPYIVTKERDVNPVLLAKKQFIDKQIDELAYQGYSSWRNRSGMHIFQGALRTKTRDLISKYLKGDIEEDELCPENSVRWDYNY